MQQRKQVKWPKNQLLCPNTKCLAGAGKTNILKYMEMDYGVQFSLKRNKILQLVVCLSILVEQCCNVSCVILFDSLALT